MNSFYPSSVRAFAYAAFLAVVDAATGQTGNFAWTTVLPPSGVQFVDVAYGRGLWIASATGGYVYTSPDGVNFTRVTNIDMSRDYGDIVVGPNDIRIATTVGQSLVSSDGINWAIVQNGTVPVQSGPGQPPGPSFVAPPPTAYGGGIFVSAGSNWLATSTDGKSWTPRTLPRANDRYHSAAYGNGAWVAVGDAGRIVWSMDLGQTWSGTTVGAGHDFQAVTFGSGRFVTVGEDGVIATSVNGQTWSMAVAGDLPVGGSPRDLWDICSLPGRFVAVGLNHRVLSSTDGLNWGLLNGPGNISYQQELYDVATDGQRVVAVGSPGLMISSAAPAFIASPTITSAPQPAHFWIGQHVQLNATVAGDDLTYQWLLDGEEIPGATTVPYVSQSFALNTASSGNYQLMVTNGGGTVTTAPVMVEVTPYEVGRLNNVSVRTQAGDGENAVAVGFAIGGSGTSGAANLLLRAVGPSLGQFGVADVVADPVLTLRQGSRLVELNDNWGGDSRIKAIGDALGAFPLVSTMDAALSNLYSSSLYSATVSSATSGTSGIALLEVYEIPTTGPRAIYQPRLINVSARARVGTGDGVLIAGFNVTGTTPCRVLVRGIGPGLAPFNVSGRLTDPILAVIQNNRTLQENDDWGDTPAMREAFASVGAFGLVDGSKDAALILTLAPGGYSARLSGVGGETGIGLIEVYELP